MADVGDREGLVHEPVDWDDYELIMDFEPPNPQLIVSGTTPYPMDVAIEPGREVVTPPDYWPTFVVGYHEPTTTEVLTEYTASIRYEDLSRGTKGIELIGKTKHENIDLPGIASRDRL